MVARARRGGGSGGGRLARLLDEEEENGQHAGGRLRVMAVQPVQHGCGAAKEERQARLEERPEVVGRERGEQQAEQLH